MQCIPESEPLPAITQGVGTNVNRFISYTVIMFNSFRGGSFFCFCPYVFFFLSCILFKWKAAKLTRRRVVSPCNLGAFPDLWVGFFFFLFFLRSSPKSNSFSDTSKAPCRVTGEWVCVCVCAVYLLRRMCAAPLLSGGFFSSLTEGAQESLHLDFSKALF